MTKPLGLIHRVEDLMPKGFQRRIDDMSEEYLEMTEAELIRVGEIKDIDWNIRTSLWSKIDILQKKQSLGKAILRMCLDDVSDGVCTPHQLKKRLDDPVKFAFFTLPLKSFEEQTDGLLRIAMARMKEVLHASVTRPDGTLDTATANLMLNITKMLADRKFGQAVERRITKKVEEKTTTPEEMEAEIESLEAELLEDGNQ
jgi:hypothetical protein